MLSHITLLHTVMCQLAVFIYLFSYVKSVRIVTKEEEEGRGKILGEDERGVRQHGGGLYGPETEEWEQEGRAEPLGVASRKSICIEVM